MFGNRQNQKDKKKNSTFAALGNQRTNVHFLIPAFGCRPPISHWPGRWFLVAGLDNNWPGAGPGNKTCSMQLAIPPPSVPSCPNLHFYASAVLVASGSRCCFIFLFTARTLKSPKLHSAQHPTNQLGQWPGASGSPSSSVLGSPTTMATLLFLGALGVVKVEVVQPGKKYDTMGKNKIIWEAPFWKG